MNKKERKKIAQQLAELEKAHNSPNISADKRAELEALMMAITQKVMSSKSGIEDMLAIDELVQELLTN